MAASPRLMAQSKTPLGNMRFSQNLSPKKTHKCQDFPTSEMKTENIRWLCILWMIKAARRNWKSCISSIPLHLFQCLSSSPGNLLGILMNSKINVAIKDNYSNFQPSQYVHLHWNWVTSWSWVTLENLELDPFDY